MADVLSVYTLGTFSVSIGDRVISDSSARSQKVWKIFKHLITNRHRMVPVETLIEVIWPGEGPENPQKSLYTLISRLRKLLNDNGASGQYILFQHDCYQWNPKMPVFLDVAEFEQSVSAARTAQDDREKTVLLKKAIDLYVGGYLSEIAYEAWVQPVTNYYRRLYLSAVNDLADVYTRLSEQESVVWLCSKAIENEPYEESLYERLIQTLIIEGKVAEAKKHYSYFSDLMEKEFGARPSEGLRALYLEMQGGEGEQLDLSSIKRKLDEGQPKNGVFFCTADIFNQIYQFDKRSDERLRFPVFLGLVTLVFDGGDIPGEKALKNAMNVLRQSIMRTLRKGDIVSQYSKNQYLLMLSAYSPENSQTAVTRVRRSFEEDSGGIACSLEIGLSQIGHGSMTKN